MLNFLYLKECRKMVLSFTTEYCVLYFTYLLLDVSHTVSTIRNRKILSHLPYNLHRKEFNTE